MRGVWAVLVVAAVFGTSAACASEGAFETAGRLDAVTVYRGQALVTRLVDVPGPAGLREVVVTGLPNEIAPESLYAESADGVEVRSVRYRTRPVEQDVREEVRALDAQLAELQRKQTVNGRRRQDVEARKAYLAKLEGFVAPTATTELTHGVLDAETLATLTRFMNEERGAIADLELELTFEQQDLASQTELLQRKRAELTGASARTAREAVVFVNVTAERGRMRVRYLVNQASWAPSYNIRTDAGSEQVRLEANASIHQRSGEDWNDVEMTLSTATPSLVSKAPVLSPLAIRLAAPGKGQPQAGPGYKQARRDLEKQKMAVSNARNTMAVQQQMEQVQRAGQAEVAAQMGAIGHNDAELNRLATALQNLDLMTHERIRRDKAERRTEADEAAVTYRLAARTSLPSRSDRQLIQIAAVPLSAEFYKVATPVLSDLVYDEADLVNESGMVLLSGSVASYVRGDFVGHGQIPTVAIGEHFTVGLGIDSSLRAHRELVQREEHIQGGNRIVKFAYRLALENFGEAAASVRLYDRLPQPERSDIKLTLSEAGEPLSEDPAYVSGPRKKGILRWQAEVPAQAMGVDAKAIEYEFQLEYDKQMAIAGLAMAGTP
jgi:hypothetical protein